jgi:hypothetical protein
MRYWVKKTCSAFETRRLPKEESARDRRKAASKRKPSAKAKSTTSASERGTTGHCWGWSLYSKKTGLEYM